MSETGIRRSFVRRVCAAAGARFVAIGDGEVAAEYGDQAGEVERARQLGLVDLSPLRRIGFKGGSAPAWLRGLGLTFETVANRAFTQADGSIVAMLSSTEALILQGPHAESGFERFDAWSLDAAPGCYRLERRDSHYWFVLTGTDAATTMSKLCPVDLRPGSFAGGQVAQTTAARSNIVIIRADLGGVLAFHLLGDSASAAYVWACVVDAMAEHGGRPVGLSALRRLAPGR